MNALDKPLYIRMPNWIGDCIMALPTLFSLSDCDYQLILLGKPWLGKLFANFWPCLNIKNVKANQVIHDAPCILLTNSFSSAKAIKQLGLKGIGYRGDWRRWLLAKSIKKPIGIHESDTFLQLAHYLCSKPDSIKQTQQAFKTHLELHIKPLETTLIRQHAFLIKPFILICPFAIGTNKQGEAKQWPLWQAWIKAYHALNPETPIICCPADNEHLDFEGDTMSHMTVLEHIDLSHYYAIMQMADAVYGNDTGPMHMAALVNEHTYTIFGVTDPLRTCPLGSQCIGEDSIWPNVEDVLMNKK